jgi:hypothetical protein
LDICGAMGALSATYVLEHNGPQNKGYNLEDYINRFRQNYDDKVALDVLLKTERV